MKNLEFSKAISQIISETLDDFEKSGTENPYEWLVRQIMETDDISYEQAKTIADELIEGLTDYRNFADEQVNIEELTESKISKSELDTQINDIVEITINEIKNEKL